MRWHRFGWGILGFVAASASGQVQPPSVPLAKKVPAAVATTVNLGQIDPSQPLTVSISLPYRDQQGMQQLVDAVSNPRSATYRHFITPAQVGLRFGPLPSTIQQVSQFLTDNGMKIQLVGQNGLTVIADGTAAQIESTFHTEIDRFQPTAKITAVKGLLYSFVKPIEMPKEIQPYIVDVSGLENFTRPEHRGYLTPNQVQSVYDDSPMIAAGTMGQGRTVAISSWDGYRLSNVPYEYSEFNLPKPTNGVGSNITVEAIDGGCGSGTEQGEADLDIQSILGVAPLCSLLIYDGSGGDLINVLTREANDNKADIISESYGWNLDSGSKSAAHNLHLSMSAEGITYIAASGDTGTTLNYTYPNIEPEVLMVGGTTCTVNSSGQRQSETGWSGSGGGWAASTDSFNTLPSYQKGTGVPTGINYRLIPDVALNADPNTGYVVYLEGNYYVIGGTSGASPTFAGSLGDSEQQLITNGALTASNGVYRFGRIQDLLYSFNGNSSIFYDVTIGSNGKLPNGNTSSAAVGWDFVTGWGAMDFNAFVTYLSGSGLVSFTVSPASVEGGVANATGTVSMVGLAPVGGYQIQISGGDGNISYPSTVTIPAGSSSATFTITTAIVSASDAEALSATDGTNVKNASLTLNPAAISTFTISPTSAPGGNNFTGTITLVHAASPSGDTVSISGGDSNISYPYTVTVAGGAKTATFTISSSLVSASTPESITATLGASTKSASFTMTAVTLSSFALSPTSVTSGNSFTGSVTLSAAAPPGGVTVAIAGGDSNISYPATVTVPANSKTASFTVTSQVILGSDSEVLTATLGSTTKTATATLVGVSVTKLSFSPATIYGGQSSTGTVTLSEKAMAGGVTVSLSGGDSSISYPSTVTVPANATSVNFTVTSSTVQAVDNEAMVSTLASKTASATLVVRPNGVVSTLTFSPTSLAGGYKTVGTLRLSYAAGPGGVTVALSGGDSNISYPSSIAIAAGASSATFTVTTIPVSANDPETLTATLGSSTTSGSFTLLATTLTAFTVSPSSVYGGQSLTGTVTLNGPAGSQGLVVPVTGGDSNISYSSSVTVQPGATSASFAITTSAVQQIDTETLSATLLATKTAQFSVKPNGLVSSLSFSPASLAGGLKTTGTLRLSYAAGPGGVTVALSGGDSNISYPSTVSIAAGGSSATFTVTTIPVSSNVTETVTASLASSTANGSFTLVATSVTGFSVAPSSVYGGQNLTGTITLNGPAGSQGTVVTVTGGDSNISYSSSITVQPGATSATFAISSSAVQQISTETLTATLVTSKTAQFTVKPNGLVSSLTFSPSSLAGGLNTTGTLRLSYAAGPGGVTVALSGGDSSISYPSTISIAAGGSSATFTVTTIPVSSNDLETVTASLASSTAKGSFTLVATSVSTLSFSPSSVYGGQGLTGTVTLNGPAGSQGAVVNLSGGDSNVSYPSSVTVQAGATSATFSITSSAVLQNVNEALSATLTTTKSATFTLKPAGIVSSLSFSPSSAAGGNNVTGTVRLTGPSGPSGVTVSLSGGDSNISYPSTVFVAAGASTASFTASLSTVNASTPETITASIAPSSAKATITILAPSIVNFTISPTSVAGGNNGTGTVTLSGPAGPGGLTITISGGDAFVSYSSTVFIAAGSASGSFSIGTSIVTANRSESLTAKAGASKWSASLKIIP